MGVSAYGGAIAKESVMKARHAGEQLGLRLRQQRERKEQGQGQGQSQNLREQRKNGVNGGDV